MRSAVLNDIIWLKNVIWNQWLSNLEVDNANFVGTVIPGEGPAPIGLCKKKGSRISAGTSMNMFRCYNKFRYHIDDSVQDCSNSSALAMELLQSYSNPSIYGTNTKGFLKIYLIQGMN